MEIPPCFFANQGFFVFQDFWFGAVEFSFRNVIVCSLRFSRIMD